jgi:hypothetical protein
MRKARQNSKAPTGRRDAADYTQNRASVLMVVGCLVVGMALPELSNIMRGLLALLEAAQ